MVNAPFYHGFFHFSSPILPWCYHLPFTTYHLPFAIDTNYHFTMIMMMTMLTTLPVYQHTKW